MFIACSLLVALGYRYGIECLKISPPVQYRRVTDDVTEGESFKRGHLATHGSLEVSLFQILQRSHNVSNRN